MKTQEELIEAAEKRLDVPARDVHVAVSPEAIDEQLRIEDCSEHAGWRSDCGECQFADMNRRHRDQFVDAAKNNEAIRIAVAKDLGAIFDRRVAELEAQITNECSLRVQATDAAYALRQTIADAAELFEAGAMRDGYGYGGITAWLARPEVIAARKK